VKAATLLACGFVGEKKVHVRPRGDGATLCGRRDGTPRPRAYAPKGFCLACLAEHVAREIAWREPRAKRPVRHRRRRGRS